MKTPPKSKIGKIIPNGVHLEIHEYNTILFLTSQGINVELLIPSDTPHSKNADLMMLGLIWEMKCPQGTSRHCIERLFRKAAHQAEHIVLDLRLVKINAVVSEDIAIKLFRHSRRVRRIIIITKNGKMLDLKK